MMRDSGSVKLYCILASASPLPRAGPCSWPARAPALPRLAWLRESSSIGSLAAPTPPATHRRSGPAHSEHPLLRLLSLPVPAAFLPPPAIAFRPLASARSSWPCACSHWLLPCCHPTPLAPASSSPPATRSAAPGQTTLAAPTDAACENPRWFGNPVHCPPPASGSPHLPLTFSGSAARKILPRSSRRAKSWSSCADGMEADLAPLLHRPTRSRSDPADRPHPRQNAPSDSPATNRAGSAATVNLVQEGKPGKLSPCCQTGISFL